MKYRTIILFLIFGILFTTAITGVVSADNTTYDNGNLSDDDVDEIYNRTLHRVETLTNYSYEQYPEYTLITSKEFENDTYPELVVTTERTELIWNDALFITSTDQNYSDEVSEILSEGVGGYYLPNNNQLVVVVEKDASGYTIDTGTLAHELVHAQQDDQYGLPNSSQNKTYDSEAAYTAGVEGNAVEIEEQYLKKCTNNEWECLEQPEPDVGTSDFNEGILMYQLFPYTYGYSYVKHRPTQSVFNNPPTETRQIIRNTSTRSVPNNTTFATPKEWFFTESSPDVNRLGSVLIASHVGYHSQNTANYPLQKKPSRIENSPPHRSGFSYNYTIAEAYQYDTFIPLIRKSTSDRGFIWRIKWNNSSSSVKYGQAYKQVLTESGGTKITEDDKTFYRVNKSSPVYYHVGVTEANETVIIFAESKESIIDLQSKTDGNEFSTIQRNWKNIDIFEYMLVSIILVFLLLLVFGNKIGKWILKNILR